MTSFLFKSLFGKLDKAINKLKKVASNGEEG